MNTAEPRKKKWGVRPVLAVDKLEKLGHIDLLMGEDLAVGAGGKQVGEKRTEGRHILDPHSVSAVAPLLLSGFGGIHRKSSFLQYNMP